jgi:hypothetical protein
LRHGARSLSQAPLLLVTAALSLGLGIGANTMLYSLMREILLTPPSAREPQNVISFWSDTLNPGSEEARLQRTLPTRTLPTLTLQTRALRGELYKGSFKGGLHASPPAIYSQKKHVDAIQQPASFHPCRHLRNLRVGLVVVGL